MKLLAPQEVKTMFVLKYGYPKATREYLDTLPNEIFDLLIDRRTREYYGDDKQFLYDHIFTTILEKSAHRDLEEAHKEFAEYIFNRYLEDFYVKEKLELEEYRRLNPSLLRRLIRKLLNE